MILILILRRQIRELTTTLPKLSEEQLESLGHHGTLMLTRPRNCNSSMLSLNPYRIGVGSNQTRIVMPDLYEHISCFSR